MSDKFDLYYLLNIILLIKSKKDWIGYLVKKNIQIKVKFAPIERFP